MKTKKAEGLPITMIIVAIIALIVLVLVVVIFQGRIEIIDSGLGDQVDCHGRGGRCYSTDEGCPSVAWTKQLCGLKGCGEGECCCVPE
ncbi:hypothetical protein JXB11_01120 [Candidatus Woesearchaeota archaeon]|nr:hypothetical protein [Candidatus Woesearchaeota archaeon]